jgi:hypothetical protein
MAHGDVDEQRVVGAVQQQIGTQRTVAVEHDGERRLHHLDTRRHTGVATGVVDGVDDDVMTERGGCCLQFAAPVHVAVLFFCTGERCVARALRWQLVDGWCTDALAERAHSVCVGEMTTATLTDATR